MRYPDAFEFIQLHDRDKIPVANDWPNIKPLTRAQAIGVLQYGGNIGVRIKEGYAVIDVDPRNGGSLSVLGFDAFEYPVASTGGGGWHIYVKIPRDVHFHHTMKAYPGIEFKTKGRQVVAVGSVHPNGTRYAWDTPCNDDFEKEPPAEFLTKWTVEKSTNTGTGEWTAEQLAVALSKLRVYDFQEHDEWLTLMMACHEATAGTGEDVFVNWSTSDELYANDGKAIRARWQSLKAGKSGSAGVGTLKHIFIERGITDMGVDTSIDDFAGIVEDTTLLGTISKSPLQDMCDRFHVIQEDGKLRILEYRQNEETKEKHWIRYTRKDFLEVCQSVYHYPTVKVQTISAEGKIKEADVPMAKRWIDLESEHKRTYRGGVVFMPEFPQERVGEALNLWRGFAFDPIPGSWHYLQELMLNVLCRGDIPSYEYTLNWMGRAVQLPHIPAGTAVVFKGLKGTGKGTLGRSFVRLFGAHGKHVASMGLLTGRFNAHLQDCVALFADEAYYAGDKPGESLLKALLTEPSMMYEAKGITPKQGRNCIHCLMASNMDWVVPAGLDAERRFAVFETLDEVRSAEFFDKLNQEMENGGYAAMLYDLMNRDIRKFRVHDVPNTEALAQQKMESLDIMEQWMFSLLVSDNWGGLELINGNTILAADFMTNFTIHLGRGKLYRPAETAVGMTLRKFVPGLSKVRIAKPEHRLDISVLRPWAYILPSIDEAKLKFTKALGYDVFAEKP